jgi:hypothetical protein
MQGGGIIFVGAAGGVVKCDQRMNFVKSDDETRKY